MQRLSYPTETDLTKKITRNRIVLSLKDSPRKPLGRRPAFNSELESSPITVQLCWGVYFLRILSSNEPTAC